MNKDIFKLVINNNINALVDVAKDSNLNIHNEAGTIPSSVKNLCEKLNVDFETI